MNTLAVIYAAKSTQDRKDSIGTQLAECREMAEENGWTVVGEFFDEGFSAYSGNRGPDLLAAQAAAQRAAQESGTVCMLIAQAHDRFARGAGDRPDAPESLGEIWHRMRRLNVHLRTVEDDEELRDEASVAAIGRRAHIDSQRKSRSVRKGMARRRAKGIHAGGDVFGYDRDPDVGLVPNPAQADVVRRIFQMVAEGTPQSEVVRILNAEGVKPLRGDAWQQGSISVMLRRRTYLGEIPADNWRERANRNIPEAWTEGAHEVIVSAELFNAATASTKRRPNDVRPGRRPKAGHLLTGDMLHHSCGNALVPRSGNARKDGVIPGTYTCSGAKRGLCEGLTVPMTAVDDAILGYLASVGVDAQESVKRAHEATRTAREAAQRQLEAAETDATKAVAAVERVESDYLDGKITADDWNRLRVKLEATKAETATRLGAVRARAAGANAEDVVPAVVDALAVVRHAVAERNTDGVRDVLRTLFADFRLGTPSDVLGGNEPREAPIGASGWRPLEPDDEDVLPEAAPMMATDDLEILPIPRLDALSSVVDEDGRQSYLVDADGHDVLRKLPVPIRDVQSLQT